ncbi:hypothetical protein NDU88_000576 [Pleurodeles waltl]|uniref:Uncharacterized protein n=1 Tax=Pleurodeles waltl TaxID=8319 RepID=A0AAV7S6I4_PLEWA|nr:hypothetical protein NDU88_000576 [Pleurodeles waltl]
MGTNGPALSFLGVRSVYYGKLLLRLLLWPASNLQAVRPAALCFYTQHSRDPWSPAQPPLPGDGLGCPHQAVIGLPPSLPGLRRSVHHSRTVGLLLPLTWRLQPGVKRAPLCFPLCCRFRQSVVGASLSATGLRTATTGPVSYHNQDVYWTQSGAL